MARTPAAALPAQRRAGVGEDLRSSERRQAAAEKRLRAAGERVTVDDIKAALDSHEDAKQPVCCHHETRAQGYTAACTTFVLGDRPEMHVSAGPPCTAPFSVHRF